MDIDWDSLARTDWDAAHTAATAPLQQDWCYGEAMKAQGARVLRAAIRHGPELAGIAQVSSRRLLPGVGLSVCLRGPVWLAPLTLADKSAALRRLRAALPGRFARLGVIAPETEDPVADGLPAWRRVMTGYSTIHYDLTPDLDRLRAALTPKWRNRLVVSERSRLAVQCGGAEPGRYDWLLEQEEKQRRRRGYLALPNEFIRAFAAAGAHRNVIALTAFSGGERAAGVLLLCHGRAATYHLGWTGEAGRETCAHHLLLWEAVKELKQRGFARLDMGGVNTESGAGIARFKIGMNGRVLTLAGTYL